MTVRVAPVRFVLDSGRRVAVHRTTTQVTWFPAERPSRGPEERVVVFCHSAPGAGVFDPDPSETRARNVRLISVDRPGYGRSTAIAAGTAPTIPSHADDLAAALEALDVAEAAAVGWSAGGRIALALAARHPGLVRAVAVVATPAPHEDVPWIPDEHVAMIGELAGDPGGATAALSDVFADMAAMPPAAAVAMVAAGAADEIVTPAHGEWYTAQVPGSTLRVVAGAGHLVALTAWADVLAAVA